jgi:hypothetical protein
MAKARTVATTVRALSFLDSLMLVDQRLLRYKL